MRDLNTTGERVIEDSYQESSQGYAIYLMHKASYFLAKSWCTGKIVLDYGCGTGYGSKDIAADAHRIDAVDVSPEAIEFAQTHYQAPNLCLSVIAANKPLPFQDEIFDVVLSFQVIEHVKDDDFYISEAKRVLKPNGTLILITPDRKNRLFSWQQPWNRWHIREYSEKSLQKLVSKHFNVTQKLCMHATSEVAGLELTRYERTKWLTLPFTLPFYPYFLRKKLLGILAMLNNITARKNTKKTGNYSNGTSKPDDILFSSSVKDSLNLVFILTKSNNEKDQ